MSSDSIKHLFFGSCAKGTTCYAVSKASFKKTHNLVRKTYLKDKISKKTESYLFFINPLILFQPISLSPLPHISTHLINSSKLNTVSSENMYSNNGSSYRPGGDLYRPGRYPPRQGNQGRDESKNRFNDRASGYGERSSYRSDYRSGSGGPGGPGGQSRPNNFPKSHSNNIEGKNPVPHSRVYGSNQTQVSNRQRTHQRPQGDSHHLVYAQIQAENQVWMGDLDSRWTEADIADIWASLGIHPVNVKIMRDKAGRSQYSFVTFANPAAANLAVQKHRTPVPGSSRIFKLNKASSSNTGTDPTRSHHQASNQGGARSQVDYSLFVGDLAQEITEQMLFDRFNQEYPGSIKQVKVMSDNNTGASKGFGFVRFHLHDTQQQAFKKMNGVILGDRAIRVGLANGGSQEPASAMKKTSIDQNLTVKIPQQQPSLSPASDCNNCVLTIKGLTMSITKEDLVAHFISFGTLVYCEIDYKAHVAHVKFLARGSAEKAFIFLSDFAINGCNLSLKWGREEKLSKSKLKTTPITNFDRNSKYVAAEKPPLIYGRLNQDIVLGDLTDEDLDQLQFIDPCDYLSVEEIDSIDQKKVFERDAYLESAF